MEEGYNVSIFGMNRGLTVALAVYRYCLVFYPLRYVDPLQKKSLENKLKGLFLGESMHYVFMYVQLY